MSRDEVLRVTSRRARAFGDHAFLDGNKRVGAAAAELLVEVNGYRLRAEDADLEKVTFSVARGELSVISIPTSPRLD